MLSAINQRMFGRSVWGESVCSSSAFTAQGRLSTTNSNSGRRNVPRVMSAFLRNPRLEARGRILSQSEDDGNNGTNRRSRIWRKSCFFLGFPKSVNFSDELV